MEQLNKRMEINGISKTFYSDKGYFTAIKDVSFDVNDGEFLVILGPGRCGKTVLLNIIAGLEQQTEGKVVYNGREWKGVNPEISMVFQKLALMPFKTVMENVELGLKFRGMSKGQRRELAQHYIELVGLKGFEKSYPTQLSGGMKQRVVIAIALACNPKVLIADEPTTALDVTIQAQVLEMMRRLKDKYHTATLLITHDLGVVAQMCEKVAIIYAGEVVESGAVLDIYKHTLHPYTEGLLGAIPQVHLHVHRLSPIDGLMPDPTAQRTGCPFADRCKYAFERCRVEHPRFIDAGNGHRVRCFKVENELRKGAGE